jgi:hypothetical protein
VRLLDELARVQAAADAALIGHHNDAEAGAVEKANRVNAPRKDAQRRIRRQIPQLLDDCPVAIEKHRRRHTGAAWRFESAFEL